MNGTSKLAVVLVLASSAALAREYAPRVVSPHNADGYSMKTFAQYARWKDLKPEDKVFEVFKYLVDQRTGVYPFGIPCEEGRDTGLWEFRVVRDPVKLLNVHTLCFCDAMGPTFSGMIQEMGIAKESRTINIHAWGHVAGEVLVDNKWIYLDYDARAIFRRDDGSLCSMDDAKKDPALWKSSSPLFFPGDKPSSVRLKYEKTNVTYRHGVYTSGHTMDYVLRRGETLIRWWKPQGGRWRHFPALNTNAHLLGIIEREPRGPKCKHAGWTLHTHANGLFAYKPNLTSKSSDFDDGVYDSKNVQPGASGLTLKEPGEGFAIFEVRSPYIIVPVVGKTDTTDDDRDASIVKLDSSGATLSISLDNGLTWSDLAYSGAPLDLTPQVSGAYGYLLRVNLKGEPEKAVVRSLQLDTWVLVHPASLPSLRKGKNAMEYRTGDHHGLQTRVMEIRSFASDKQDFLKYMHEAPQNFDPARKLTRVVGPFVAKVQPPPNTSIAWFSAGGNFNTHQQKQAADTRNTMAYAANEPRDYKQFYKAAVPTNQDHWHYNADVEVKLPEPAKTVYLQYVGDPGVNNIRVYAHCLDNTKYAPAPILIKHAWTENGQAKSQSVKIEKPGPYEINAEGDPLDESIEIAIPSSAQ